MVNTFVLLFVDTCYSNMFILVNVTWHVSKPMVIPYSSRMHMIYENANQSAIFYRCFTHECWLFCYIRGDFEGFNTDLFRMTGYIPESRAEASCE